MKRSALLAIFTALFLVACSNQDSVTSSASRNEKQIKLLAILPMDSASAKHWKRTADWFNGNLEEAFGRLPLDSAFAFDIEWVDENNADMDSLGDAITRRNDITAVIGPLHSQNIDTIAQYMRSANKNGNGIPLLAPMATATETVRKYVGEKWFFGLTDTDISQSEILLGQAIASYAKTISLLISSSEEQKTFLDWLTFQATEYETVIKNIYIYDDSTQLTEMAERAFGEDNDYIVCVPQSHRDLPAILKAQKEHGKKIPVLFGNTAHDKNILDYEDIEGIEGISIGASPESGFDIAYVAKFKESPITGEAQFYDAFLLTAFAQMQLWSNGGRHIENAIDNVVSNDTSASEFFAWESISMSRIMKKIIDGENFNIGGASGSLDIKSGDGMTTARTYYNHWKVIGKTFVQMEYLSLNGSRRSVSTTASNNWINKTITSATGSDSTASLITYPVSRGNYALLIATSESWLNYRHQADILNIYNKLKTFGMNDSQIVLIVEDNLAESPMNPNPGTMIDNDGKSIHEDIHADYKTSELLPGDIVSILAGNKNERLHTVMDTDSTKNIFVYWSGHGMRDWLVWPSNPGNENFTPQHMEKILEEMSREKKFRKMLWIFETCYAGNICETFEKQGQKGTLCIAAATENETSKAEDFNPDYGVYMTNSFTKNFLHELDQLDMSDFLSDVTLNDLYYYTVKNTLGSHATLYNADHYGSLHVYGLREFFTTD